MVLSHYCCFSPEDAKHQQAVIVPQAIVLKVLSSFLVLQENFKMPKKPNKATEVVDSAVHKF